MAGWMDGQQDRRRGITMRRDKICLKYICYVWLRLTRFYVWVHLLKIVNCIPEVGQCDL